MLFKDNIFSLFVLEGILPNIHLHCKLTVSLLAALFVVFHVNLVFILFFLFVKIPTFIWSD